MRLIITEIMQAKGPELGAAEEARRERRLAEDVERERRILIYGAWRALHPGQELRCAAALAWGEGRSEDELRQVLADHARAPAGYGLRDLPPCQGRCGRRVAVQVPGAEGYCAECRARLRIGPMCQRCERRPRSSTVEDGLCDACRYMRRRKVV